MAQSSQLSTLILTTQNDERLFSCLQSVKWCTEIILGWTHPEKITQKEEKKLLTYFPNLRIIHLPGAITDFSSARNQLQEHASFEWVLWIDSDEQLEKGSRNQIVRIIDEDIYSGVTLQREDVFHKKRLHWGEVRNVHILRLFKKSAAHFERPVHEVAVVQGSVLKSKITLLHFAHPSLSSFLTKIIHYSSIEAELRYSQGKRTTVVELAVWPVGKFFSNMVLKLGVLDGWRGTTYAVMMSIHSLAVRAYLLEKQHDSQTPS